jgi:hypothetical protein
MIMQNPSIAVFVVLEMQNQNLMPKYLTLGNKRHFCKVSFSPKKP